MTTTTGIELSEQAINELAAIVMNREDAYVTEYNRLNDLGQIRNENYAPVSSLCSNVFREYLEAQNKTIDDYAWGTVGRILNRLKQLRGV